MAIKGTLSDLLRQGWTIESGNEQDGYELGYPIDYVGPNGTKLVGRDMYGNGIWQLPETVVTGETPKPNSQYLEQNKARMRENARTNVWETNRNFATLPLANMSMTLPFPGQTLPFDISGAIPWLAEGVGALTAGAGAIAATAPHLATGGLGIAVLGAVAKALNRSTGQTIDPRFDYIRQEDERLMNTRQQPYTMPMQSRQGSIDKIFRKLPKASQDAIRKMAEEEVAKTNTGGPGNGGDDKNKNWIRRHPWWTAGTVLSIAGTAGSIVPQSSDRGLIEVTPKSENDFRKLQQLNRAYPNGIPRDVYEFATKGGEDKWTNINENDRTILRDVLSDKQIINLVDVVPGMKRDSVVGQGDIKLVRRGSPLGNLLHPYDYNRVVFDRKGREALEGFLAPYSTKTTTDTKTRTGTGINTSSQSQAKKETPADPNASKDEASAILEQMGYKSSNTGAGKSTIQPQGGTPRMSARDSLAIKLKQSLGI